MRAMLLERPLPAEQNPLRLVELPTPEPGEGEVRVRVSYCGLCHTDLHTVEGDLALPKLPVIPGHQITGEVEAAGAGVTLVKEGDRVGVPWLYSTCGHCKYCRNSLENLCDLARFTGLHVNGGYAEYMIVGEHSAYALPKNFSDLHAAPLLCAGVIGHRALQLSNTIPGDIVGLFGFGASAHVVLQMAKHEQRRVFVFTRSEAHRELALQLGAEWAGGAKDKPPEMLGAAIVFAPAGEVVLDALRVLKKRRTCVLAGITMSQIPPMDYSLIYGERMLRSVTNSTRDDVIDCLTICAEIPVHTEVEVFRLEEANRALQALKQSRIRGAGVLQVS